MYGKKPTALTNPNPTSGSDSKLDILSKENTSLMNSIKMVDDAIGIASESNVRMTEQMNSISVANDRLTTIIQGIPYIGELAQGIQVRRKRDRLVLGGLIGFLMFFIVWYLFG
ncbi:hypothetical protein TVAG_280040 [Trichomonas vaginalis G3]|uniref:Uncharacterized protein n=1 Tax=Trichomonas vaginalis (strain ATCC PRA-98 / G3) TaxID=412133 RepID=A2FBL7_TRIV3|nr:GOS-28 SNARE- related family [Trichomonas vaginalis G3]EAX97703.1 hypothetical protein TVAG_280040 [Trichomonas vaginalis G3]KAI5497066.1 GOS-28 SNARE- related family [Trichomonas vaginalis G3]|eukprot:XP_001310633.1 hypothetical protein [Trichomonas vaginalis G3]